MTGIAVEENLPLSSTLADDRHGGGGRSSTLADDGHSGGGGGGRDIGVLPHLRDSLPLRVEVHAGLAVEVGVAWEILSGFY